MNPVFEEALPFGTYKVFGEKPNFEFKKVHQVHSDLVINLKDNERPEEIKADGLIASTDFNIPLVIVTADCLPILIQGEKGIGFVHAGWRGLENQILSHELIRSLEPKFAFIGPHISQKNYEVGPEFKEHFPNSMALKEIEGRLCFDLGQEAEIQLNKLYAGIKVENSNVCTFDSEKLHSFRQNKTELRNWNVFFY